VTSPIMRLMGISRDLTLTRGDLVWRESSGDGRHHGQPHPQAHQRRTPILEAAHGTGQPDTNIIILRVILLRLRVIIITITLTRCTAP
jgi:hypothetical protein